MASYTITVDGVDEDKLKEAVDIAVEAVRGALEKAGLGGLEVDGRDDGEGTVDDAPRKAHHRRRLDLTPLHEPAGLYVELRAGGLAGRLRRCSWISRLDHRPVPGVLARSSGPGMHWDERPARGGRDLFLVAQRSLCPTQWPTSPRRPAGTACSHRGRPPTVRSRGSQSVSTELPETVVGCVVEPCPRRGLDRHAAARSLRSEAGRGCTVIGPPPSDRRRRTGS